MSTDGVVHYCVTNMPGAVGRTSTFALCNVTLPWALRLAGRGGRAGGRSQPGVGRGGQYFSAEVTNRAVAETFGMPFVNRFGLPESA